MENEQNTGLAPVTEVPTVSTPTTEIVAPAVQPEVKQEIVSSEPRHPLMDVLDKAAERAKAKEATSKEVVKDTTLGVQPPVVFDYSKWDGNVLTLPDNIQKIVKDNQAGFHQAKQEAAEIKQQYDQLSKVVNDYTQQQQQLKDQQALFTEQEFQEAQLDPNKFLDLTQRVANSVVQKERQQLEPILAQVQFSQQVAENEKSINSFTQKNKDFWPLYEAGILEPFIAAHGLEKGYQMASGIANKLKQDAMSQSQQRVQEKKAAITSTPTQAGTVQVVYVNNPNEVLSTAARYAAEGKKVKVRYKPD